MILCENCSPRKGCTADKNRTECRFYQPMTEQEYLQTCDTEQLAGFIADVCYELVDDIWSNCEDTSCNYRQTEKDYWVEWLKQPHTEKG